MLDAEPDHIEEFPGPTVWPLMTALATTGLFISTIFTPWGVVWGTIPVALALIGWFWPKKREAEERPPEEVKEKLGEEEALRLTEEMS
jgi:cytochrome c oxidase subunit 1